MKLILKEQIFLTGERPKVKNLYFYNYFTIFEIFDILVDKLFYYFFD